MANASKIHSLALPASMKSKAFQGLENRRFSQIRTSSRTVLILASVLVAIAIFNLFVVSSMVSQASSKKEKAATDSAELLRPANISIIALGAGNCADCYDISKVVSAIKSASVNVVSEKAIDYTASEAKPLIQKYGITKIPALIISGEINKSNVKDALSGIGPVVEGAIVFSNPAPVYINVSGGNAVGRVSAIIISADSCAKCKNLSQVVASFEANGIAIRSEKTYDYGSAEAKSLLSKYNITMAPAIMFSSDLGAYPSIAAAWKNIGSVEPDGEYVVRAPFPPYVEISTNKTRGIVSLVNIVDGSCPACYNVSVHKQALLLYGVSPSGETAYDISSAEGMALLLKYNITRVPTIILSSETSAYTQLAAAWASLGTVENDGSYVFRAVSQMGTYKDLLSNKTVTKGSQ